MANTRNANTWYVDTVHSSSSDDLVIKNVRVLYAVVTSTGAAGNVSFADVGGNAKLDLRVASQNGSTNGDTRAYDFTVAPVIFPNGIKVSALSNCVATLIVQETSK